MILHFACLLFFQHETPTRTLWIRAGFGAFGLFLTGLLTIHVFQYKLRKSAFNLIALEELSKHSKIIDLIGEPVKAGYVYSRKKGSIQKNSVDCVVPVYGKNVDGLIKYQADKLDGEWALRRMEFTFLDQAGGVLRLVKNEESSNHVNPEIIIDASKS